MIFCEKRWFLFARECGRTEKGILCLTWNRESDREMR